MNSIGRGDAGSTEGADVGTAIPRYAKDLQRERGKVSKHSGLVVLIHKLQCERYPFMWGSGVCPRVKGAIQAAESQQDVLLGRGEGWPACAEQAGQVRCWGTAKR